MNLTNAPAVPALLDCVDLITFFVMPETEEWPEESDSAWVVRTYACFEGRAPLAVPAGAPSVMKGFECGWQACDDYPSLDDPDRVVPKGFDDSELECESAARTKI